MDNLILEYPIARRIEQDDYIYPVFKYINSSDAQFITHGETIKVSSNEYFKSLYKSMEVPDARINDPAEGQRAWVDRNKNFYIEGGHRFFMTSFSLLSPIEGFKEFCKPHHDNDKTVYDA